jgi:hypothetical protein
MADPGLRRSCRPRACELASIQHGNLGSDCGMVAGIEIQPAKPSEDRLQCRPQLLQLCDGVAGANVLPSHRGNESIHCG